MSAQPAGEGSRVRLRPQNPFDLIRLLARSQSDPRKAVAELVQNSLDAGAQQIEITWFNEKGRRALSIHDDGAGVFPELDRVEALRRIARTIGHSHKRDLTPAQRREQMVLGRYGIGLIGFWSVGAILEMKSRVGSGRAWVLRLREDESEGDVFPSRSRLLGERDTFTEVTIRAVHEAALNKVRPPRLQAYLANELRGQLLERDAVVTIRDRVARGRARKEFMVRPRPYLGRPVDAWRELEVPGFEAARVELYLVEEERTGVVALSCGGTTVLDDIAEIDGVDAPRAPWSAGRLEGVIDFPELHVSPGTRRGFSHDEPVAAFLAALAGLEKEIEALLAEEARRRSTERQEQVAREIRRAFRSVARRLPEYDFFGVRGRRTGGEHAAEGEPVPGAETTPSGDAEGTTAGGAEDGRDAANGEAPPGAQESPDAGADRAADKDRTPDETLDALLFPPGPLAAVELVPRRLRLPPMASRRVRARALDADGRPCAGEVSWSWSVDGDGELEADEAVALYTAPELPHPVRETHVRVRATQGGEVVEASAPVLVVDPDTGRRVAGIPEPHPVSAPGEWWRSRLRAGRWEYNDSHRDYLEVADVEARRVRYLIHLFAKEVVLKNFGGPGDHDVLERMVEVLTSLDTGRK